MRVVITGARGFLGWHTRVRMRALRNYDVVPVDSTNWGDLSDLVGGADAIVHLAGINRAPDKYVEEGNARLGSEVAEAVRQAPGKPTIVYANTIQAGNETPYGRGKKSARLILEQTALETGSPFANVVLPNLFGEHGRPDYNSFVATFAHKVAAGDRPEVQDREVELLHVQDAAQVLIEQLHAGGHRVVRPEANFTTVASVFDILSDQFSVYKRGEIPVLPTRMHVRIFNTLRSAMFPSHYPIALVRHADHRGSLIETVRARGSEGQTFVSTTVPGITRGQHFHLRKVERFVVVGGKARVSLRKMLTKQVLEFDVEGGSPSIIDMPTMWTHNITNIGTSELVTVFWTNELFDPQDTDTYHEDV